MYPVRVIHSGIYIPVYHYARHTYTGRSAGGKQPLKKIDAVSMVRKIRDKQSKEIANKSTQDIIDYFRKKADRINKKVEKFEMNQP